MTPIGIGMPPPWIGCWPSCSLGWPDEPFSECRTRSAWTSFGTATGSILNARDDFYASGHPTPADVLLVIEVADSSTQFDRDVKVPLYARSGIPEVWRVDLQEDRVETFSQPAPDG